MLKITINGCFNIYTGASFKACFNLALAEYGADARVQNLVWSAAQ